MKIEFNLDNNVISENLSSHLRLSVFLQNLDSSPIKKTSCSGHGCGKCLISKDKHLVYSCLLPLVQVRNSDIKTALVWKNTLLYKYFMWSLAVHKLTLCYQCSNARFLSCVSFLESGLTTKEDLYEYINLVTCTCTSIVSIEKIFLFVKKLKDVYAK